MNSSNPFALIGSIRDNIRIRVNGGFVIFCDLISAYIGLLVHFIFFFFFGLVVLFREYSENKRAVRE